MVDSLQALEPEEVAVWCGIKVGVAGGVPFFGLAKASGEASYNVTLRVRKNITFRVSSCFPSKVRELILLRTLNVEVRQKS